MQDQIIYQDDYFIAVNKQAGQLVVKDRFNLESNVLLTKLGSWLRMHGHGDDSLGRNLFPVHRLDRDTSGIVLFAKTKESHRLVSKIFEDRKVKKTYWSIILTQDIWQRAVVRIPIMRTTKKSDRGRAKLNSVHGRPSETYFEVLDRSDDLQLIKVRPLTGRLHQIRIHLNAIGCAMPGDTLYGKNMHSDINFLPLHAKELEFIHPYTQEAIHLRANIPDCFRKVVSKIKKSKRLEKN